MRRPVCALFAGALGAQLIAAFEPQAGFWPLAALFGFAGLVLAAGGRARGYGLWLLLGAALGLGFSVRTGAQFSALTERYDGRTVRLTATVEDVQEGYTRATVRARLRVETADGEAAAFCCQCDGLPLCEAGETIEGWFSLEAPAPADRPGRYADGVALLAEYADLLVVMEDGAVRFADAPEAVLAHAAELYEIGVNCPRSTSLVNRLRSCGLSVARKPLTDENGEYMYNAVGALMFQDTNNSTEDFEGGVVPMIRRYDTEDVFIYADPPYLPETRKGYLYKHEMSLEQHKELLQVLSAHPGKVLLSGYDNELYDSLLPEWHKVQKATQAECGLRRTETLWMNYIPPAHQVSMEEYGVC